MGTVPTVPAAVIGRQHLIPLCAGKLLRGLLAESQRLQIRTLRQGGLNERMHSPAEARCFAAGIVDQLVGDFVVQAENCIEGRHGRISVVLRVQLKQL